MSLQQLTAVRNQKQSPSSFPTTTLESVDLLLIKYFMYIGCLYFCMSHLKTLALNYVYHQVLTYLTKLFQITEFIISPPILFLKKRIQYWEAINVTNVI